MKNRFNFDFRKLGLGLTLILAQCLYAQNRTVTGIVTDSKQEPLIGVSVILKGNTATGTITDINGRYSLSVPQEESVLVFSYIGYTSKEVAVGRGGATQTVNVSLQEDTQLLDEVVVVGYGTMKKSDLTGSVGSVLADKLAARGSVRLEDALQGAVPGVNITQTNSRAGGNYNIQIRGQASINKQASPLYVIDGVVSSSMDFLNPEDIERIDVLKDASSTAIYGSRASAGVIMITTKGSKGTSKAEKTTISYDGYYGIRNIARMPEFMNAREFMDYRFARYSILSTEAFAGSNRAGVDANGVPHYNISQGDAEVAFLMRTNGTSYRDSQLYEQLMNGSEGYDWADYVTRSASQQNHFISANGATDKVNYRLGAGYQGEENVFKHNDYSRFNIKGAFEVKLNKYVEAGLSTSMAYTVQDDFITDNSNQYSPYENAFSFNALVNPYDKNGKLLNNPGAKDSFDSPSQFTSGVNPLIDLEQKNYQNQTRKFHALANLYFRFNIMDDLKFTTTFSPNFYHGRQGIFFAKGVTDQYPTGSGYYQRNRTNRAEVENTDRFDWTWDHQIDYNNTLGDHTMGAMGLFSLHQSNTERYRMTATEISDDRLSYNAMDKAGGDKTTTSSYTESALVSAALRLNYAYKGKYMATATVRADGSSRFIEENHWGWFPSVAVAWRASEENFLKEVDWISNLKLRLSYGVTGNNNVGDYVTMSTAAGPTYVVLDGSEMQGFYPNGLVNSMLIWEKVKEFDFGVDFSVLDNRVNLTADVYRRLSDGQIMDRSVPLETGETTSTFNIGSVENKGIELGLQVGVIRTKDFNWDVTVNFSRNWNKILELSNGKVDEVANNRFIGQPLNVLRDYTHTDVITDKGVTMKTKDGDIHYTLAEFYTKYGNKNNFYEGQIAVNDWNNDGQINDDDKQIYGNTDPKWMGSLTSTMNYKNFDFSVMVYTKQGQWSQSYFHERYMNYGDRGAQHMKFDYYIPKGTPVVDYATGDIVNTTETHYGKYPYPTNTDTRAGGYFGNGSAAQGEGWRYHETSFVKVKNITLGYTMPKSWIAKAGLQHLRVYLNVINPFCFTDYEGFDPEWANARLTDGGPASVTYQIGANIKF